jgi:ABC-2 type transport system ATP-binding protein
VIVAVEDLSHSYGDRAALCGLSLRVERGCIYGVLGPNGCGKSTLFRILSTLMAPSSGRASVGGFDVVRQAQQVRRRIGVVFQSASLDRKLTVVENLRAQGRLYGLRGGELSRAAGEVLERFRLQDRANDIVETLSGGLKRRVEIAKALLHGPEVLLMDEPSTGLDPAARRELADYIGRLREERGTTVLLTTHILDEAERCDRLLLLSRGRRVAEGSPAELKARVGGDVVIFESDTVNGWVPELARRFNVQPQVIDGRVRVEIPNGHRFAAEAVEAFPGVIQSVSMHKPTLEDVFLDETGETI